MFTAEAIPARAADTADMAIELPGVPDIPMPAPSRAKSHQMALAGVAAVSRSRPSMAAPPMTSPASSGQRSPIRPVRRPDSGAVIAQAMPTAATSSPASIGDRPCTCWKKALK